MEVATALAKQVLSQVSYTPRATLKKSTSMESAGVVLSSNCITCSYCPLFIKGGRSTSTNSVAFFVKSRSIAACRLTA